MYIYIMKKVECVSSLLASSTRQIRQRVAGLEKLESLDWRKTFFSSFDFNIGTST